MADPIVETTDANGEATFTLDDYERDHDTYTATISKTHYVTQTLTFEATKDEEIDIVLESLPILTLTVTDGTNPVSGATVTIGTDEETSDSDGVVEFELAYGDYSATIEASGYTTATESLAFRSNHKNFTVTLESASSTGTVTVTCQDSQQTPLPASIGLEEGSYGDPDYKVWGVGVAGDDGTCVLKVPDEDDAPTEVTAEIPYGTYSLRALYDDGEVVYEYIDEAFVIDGDETVTITLLQEGGDG